MGLIKEIIDNLAKILFYIYMKTKGQNLLKKLMHILMLLSTVLLVACEKETPSNIRLGLDIWSGNSPFFIARAIGELDSNRVKLVQLRDNLQALEAFKNGYVDATIVSIDNIVELTASDIDFEIILITNISNGGDAIVAQSEIETLEGLKGKKVGFQLHPLYNYILARSFEKSSLTKDDIEVVDISFYDSFEEFKQGTVDAIITSQPYTSNLEVQGANILFSSKDMPNEIIDAVVIRRDLSPDDKLAVQYMVNAWYIGVDYLNKHPDPAYEIMSGMTGDTPRNNREQIRSIIFPSAPQSAAMMAGQNSELSKNVKNMELKLVELGFFDKPNNGDFVLNNQYLKNISKGGN